MCSSLISTLLWYNTSLFNKHFKISRLIGGKKLKIMIWSNFTQKKKRLKVMIRSGAKLRTLLSNFLRNRSHNWKILSNWSTVLHLIGLHYNIDLPIPWLEGTMSMNIMNILTWGPYSFVPLQRLDAVVFLMNLMNILTSF